MYTCNNMSLRPRTFKILLKINDLKTISVCEVSDQLECRQAYDIAKQFCDEYHSYLKKEISHEEINEMSKKLIHAIKHGEKHITIDISKLYHALESVPCISSFVIIENFPSICKRNSYEVNKLGAFNVSHSA